MDFKDISTKDLMDRIELYQELLSRSVRDEIILSKMDQEMERRILAWEAEEA